LPQSCHWQILTELGLHSALGLTGTENTVSAILTFLLFVD
jgi:hypothetical protein